MVRKSSDPVVATLSGSLAGCVETTSIWPMEYMKTQLQLQQKVAQPKFTGMLSCARYTFKTHGVLAFYRGLFPVLIGSIPKAGIRFGGFNYAQNKLRELCLEEGAQATPLINLGAGMLAGAVEATVAVTPIETIKTKLIDSNQSFGRGFLSIYKAEGIRGIYKGWLATVAKQSSNQGLRFMAFSIYKDFVLKRSESNTLSPIQALLGGMASGCFSTLCNNPFDMVKTRMQGLNAHLYNGFIDCFTKVVRKEGVLSLWNGTLPRLMRVVPGQGIIFMSYESISNAVARLLNRESK